MGWESGTKVDRREPDTDGDMFVALAAEVCSSWKRKHTNMEIQGSFYKQEN